MHGPFPPFEGPIWHSSPPVLHGVPPMQMTRHVSVPVVEDVEEELLALPPHATERVKLDANGHVELHA